MFLPLHLKLAAGAGGLALFAIIFGFGIFPSILKSQMKKSMTLSSKNDVRKMWAKVPFYIDFRVIVFNFTNYEEIQNGSIPVVKEIGPYFFEEWRKKEEVAESEENDTITYRKLNTFFFRPNLSAPGLTGEEEVIVPNVFMLSLFTMTLREKPHALPILKKALLEIYENPTSVFMKVKVMDLLFRGVNINCNRQTFPAKALCVQLKKEAADALIFEPNNQFKFSFLGVHNGSVDPKYITVKRGMKNIKDVGKVVAINNKTVQNVWKNKCNDIEGTDGTIFSPFIFEKDRLISYADDFCRVIEGKYVKKSKYQGVHTNRYVATIGDLPNDPDLQCYCETPENCFSGIMDITKCTNAPLYISMPHYFDTDPKILENVTGLSPNEEEHSIAIDFEPITGTPLNARNTMMFSMKLLKCDKMEAFANLPDVIVPLFWIKEDIALSKDFVSILKKSLFTPKKVVKVVSWLFTIIGLLGAAAGVFYHFTVHKKGVIKRISPEGSAQSGSSTEKQMNKPPNIFT